jgi:hypothetical protein
MSDRLAPGTPVVYHGSIHSQYGRWLAEPCACRRCLRAMEHGMFLDRYELLDLDGQRGVYPHHVRRQSITLLQVV